MDLTGVNSFCKRCMICQIRACIISVLLESGILGPAHRVVISAENPCRIFLFLRERMKLEMCIFHKRAKFEWTENLYFDVTFIP